MGFWPFDSDFGIVPGDHRLRCRVVVATAFVLRLGLLGESQEAMSEANWEKQLAQVGRTQLDGVPTAKGWRSHAQVDSDVEDGPHRAAHQLIHGGRPTLEMQPTDDALLRLRTVVLHELLANPELDVTPPVIALEEEPTVVPVDPRLDQHQAIERRATYPHLRSRNVNRPGVHLQTTARFAALTRQEVRLAACLALYA